MHKSVAKVALQWVHLLEIYIDQVKSNSYCTHVILIPVLFQSSIHVSSLIILVYKESSRSSTPQSSYSLRD